MNWSSVAKKGGWTTKPAKTQEKIEEKIEKIDYWADKGVPNVYSVATPQVEQQIKESYEKMGFEVPESVYGRSSPNDF